MHEYSIAESIAAIVKDYAAQRPGQTVTRIHLRVGCYRALVEDSLRFCLKLLFTGSPAAQAAVEIEHVPITIHCESCGVDSCLDEPLLLCPECGSFHVNVIGGKELEIDLLEFEDVCTLKSNCLL